MDSRAILYFAKPSEATASVTLTIKVNGEKIGSPPGSDQEGGRLVK
jgi:hypothetical protein